MTGCDPEEAERTVFVTPWFSVVERPTEPAWGMGEQPFLQIVVPNGVIVLPITTDGRIVMVRQYRPARRRTTLELPAGFMDPDELPETSARRELAEETGYGGGEFHSLGTGGLALNRDTGRHHLYLARGVVPVSPKMDGFIEVALVSMAELRAHAVAGDFEQLAALGQLTIAHWKYGLALD